MNRERPGAPVELTLLVALVMVGLVLCANPARYGPAGLAFGALLAGAGLLMGRRRFRRTGNPETTRES